MSETLATDGGGATARALIDSQQIAPRLAGVSAAGSKLRQQRKHLPRRSDRAVSSSGSSRLEKYQLRFFRVAAGQWAGNRFKPALLTARIFQARQARVRATATSSSTHSATVRPYASRQLWTVAPSSGRPLPDRRVAYRMRSKPDINCAVPRSSLTTAKARTSVHFCTARGLEAVVVGKPRASRDERVAIARPTATAARWMAFRQDGEQDHAETGEDGGGCWDGTNGPGFRRCRRESRLPRRTARERLVGRNEQRHLGPGYWRETMV